jgi:hypothetical protein
MSRTIEDRIQLLEDRAALTDLVSRLYALLDEERFDELDTVYTDDVELDFPSAHMHGLGEAMAMARRRAERYARMFHGSTDVLVERLDGDSAALRTNHVSVHVHPGDDLGSHFDAGIVHEFDAVRTPGGWRLSRGQARVVWTGGDVRSAV